MSDQKERTATIERDTRETKIRLQLDLDGGSVEISTGLGFLDHLLESLAVHGRLGLVVQVEGDLHVDDHHTVEDTAIALGSAFDRALAERKGIRRFGSAYAPLDEALSRVVIDLVRRPFAKVSLGLRREKLGDVACENLVHFFQSLAISAQITLHVDVLEGENDHHRVESAIKALALALREAVTADEREIASTKGTLG